MIGLSMSKRSLKKSDSGNIAISFSLSVFAILLVAGGAIDYSNIVRQQTSLQSAADAAVLSSVSFDLNDESREEQAVVYFENNLHDDLSGVARIESFDYDTTLQQARISVAAEIPVSFLKLAGYSDWPLKAVASANAGSPPNRVLDIAMCIDVTGSMQDTINAATASALGLEAQINGEMASRNLPPFDAVRAVVYSYRDFGGNNPDYRSNHYKVATGGYVDRMPNPGAVWMPAGDATNYGDQVSLQTSAHFNLPQQAGDLRDHLATLVANGGGDDPESGLECVNAALNATWLKKGESMPNGLPGTIGAVFPMIAIWTDVDAQPPAHPFALLNPNYPSDTVMPRDYNGLLAKWQDANRIDQTNKLLLTFMPSDTPVWDQIRQWPGYFNGGSLSDGEDEASDRIADALATLPSTKTPTLTE
jgi:Flp pilus assembly protein TadG